MNGLEGKEHGRKIIGFSVLGVCLILLIWAISGAVLFQYGERGSFGDMFGAVNALFSGLAFLGIIIAIVIQYQELRESRIAQQKTATALTNQLKTVEFRTRLEALNLLIEGQQRLLNRMEDNTRTLGQIARNREVTERLESYEEQLALLVENEGNLQGS